MERADIAEMIRASVAGHALRLVPGSRHSRRPFERPCLHQNATAGQMDKVSLPVVSGAFRSIPVVSGHFLKIYASRITAFAKDAGVRSSAYVVLDATGRVVLAYGQPPQWQDRQVCWRNHRFP